MAISAEDDLFLREVYVSSRRDEVSHWGWNEEQQFQFLMMQYHCQQKSYRTQYPAMECNIILHEGKKAGRLMTAETGGDLVVIDLTLLPEFQNRGLGSSLLAKMQQKAANINLPLRLSVFNGNRARRLYEKIGFRAVENNEMYTIMRWNPS
jgi:ribosomal protein S18 acetylase RimI-like enzyme